MFMERLFVLFIIIKKAEPLSTPRYQEITVHPRPTPEIKSESQEGKKDKLSIKQRYI